MKDAGSVADKFVDRYYVESDQDGALPLTTGVASMRLNDELKLTRESRQGNAGMQLRPVRVVLPAQVAHRRWGRARG